MIKVVGVRFQQAGKIYYFDPLDYELEVPMHVIVETARGVEMGTVLIPPKEVEDDKVIQPLKPVIRIATDEDEKIMEKNKEKEAEAFVICKEKIAKHGLDMKLVSAEYTFDNNKLLFYFTADGRVDFRELVKDLASVFRTRIELRQIGVRDETKILGGIGICGRVLCCKSYLNDFVPVSIKMAKEQNLSLNPTKISGVCGRLMCCLKNEEETYEYLNSRLPSVGDTVTTPSGMRGEVSAVNVLRQNVKVIVDTGEEKELQEYSVDDLTFTPRRRKDVHVTEEELKELEGLEDSGSIEEDKPKHDNRNHRDNRGRRDASENLNNSQTSWENSDGSDFQGTVENPEKSDRRDNRGYRGNRNSRDRDYRSKNRFRDKGYKGNRNYRDNRSENAAEDSSEPNYRSENGGREYSRGRNRHRRYDRRNDQDGSRSDHSQS